MKKLFFAACALLAATSAQAQSGYQIRPGDVVSVEVVQDPSLNREVLVLPDGTINFPFAGQVPASGRTPTQLQGTIAQGIAGNFVNSPDVFVTVSQIGERVVTSSAPATIDIYFLGEFATPGVAEMPRGSTLFQALALGGGFTNFAAQQRVQLRRTNPHTGEVSVATINYRAVADGASLSNDPILADGDVILVPERRLFE